MFFHLSIPSALQIKMKKKQSDVELTSSDCFFSYQLSYKQLE